MASPALRKRRENVVDQRSSSESAALRLIAAERPEEILPILLEEVVHLGFPRAAAVEVDFDSGEIKPAASLNCDARFLEKLRTSLWSGENPIVSALTGLKPVLLPDGVIRSGALYLHPMIYRSHTRCWEAERERRSDCLAVLNSDPKRKLQIQQQVCTACGMRSYISMVIGEVGRDIRQAQLRQFRNLADRANGHLSRLFKVEHYYNRMRDMDITIARMTTVMESMADPVILTDNQHRVIIQNRAAERFFRVPEGVSEGGKRAVEFNNLLFSAALSSMVVSATDTSRDLTLVDVMEGEEVLFEAVCAPTYANQARTGMVTVMRDVTDLRRADQEVRANLEKLRAAEELVRQDRDRLNVVIENVGDPIVVADNSAKIVLLDPLAKTLLTYRQGKSGFTNSPDQTIPLPPQTAWVAPCDVDAHPGLELLFATGAGFSYSRQQSGRFESEVRPLITASQIFTNSEHPILVLLATNSASQKLKDVSIPVITDQQAVVYRSKDGLEWAAEPSTPLRAQPASWHASLAPDDWAIASSNPAIHKSIHPSFSMRSSQAFLARPVKSPSKEPESETIRKLIANLKTNAMSGPPTISTVDIDGDGRKDVVVWQVTGWLDMRTDLFIFLRGTDGKLPERPTQTLHCRGFPIPIATMFNPTPLADINGDGVCELVLLEPKMTILSPNSLLEAALSHEIQWSLSIRRFKQGRISNEPEALVPLKMLLSLEDLEDWPICIQGDFNRDGHPDLLVRRTETQWNIYLSTKDSRWFEPQPAFTFNAPVHGSLEITDLKGDGPADIVCREPNEYRISIFLIR
jgi:PAS domain-containing protein